MLKKKSEFNYFDEFIKSANLARDAQIKFRKYVLEFDTVKAEERMRKIHNVENEADDNLHKIKNYLLKDFLPPIDREDIISIIHKIDDVVDCIDEAAIDMYIFNIQTIRPNMNKTLNLLEETVEAMYQLICELRNIKNIEGIKAKVIEVNKLEEQADRLYEVAIKELYVNENDAKEIMKWTRVYEAIENCFDSCENVADCIEEVLTKNS